MKVLAIETSCDDTSCAVIDENKKVLANIVQSQIKVHSKYYGIVPEIASRHHLENINDIIKCAVSDACCLLEDIDVFAVTTGPGLAGSLLVGVMTAKTLAYVYNKPLVPVNHLQAHIWANFLKDNSSSNFVPKFPAVILLVSGGHTEVCLMTDYDKIRILGRTRDDAAGEAFDKTAKLLELGYPGGPVIDKLGTSVFERTDMPRPFLPDYDFSFSGLKTAVMYKVKRNKELSLKEKHILAVSFQDAVVEVLVKKTIKAVESFNAECIMLSGGVAANSLLRRTMADTADKLGAGFHCPPLVFCTDNAAMVGAVAVDDVNRYGTEYFIKQLNTNLDFHKIHPNMTL